MKPKILVVDDQVDELETMMDLLSKDEYELIGSTSGDDALKKLQKGDIDLVLADLVLPGEINGLDLLMETRKFKLPPEFIMITGYATVETAIDAMKNGAYDYLVKPVDIKRLRLLVSKALEKRMLAKKLSAFEYDEWGFEGIIGRSPAIRNIFDTIRLVAPTSSTVLILGESGVGKELVANAIHNLSPRCTKPFFKINCSAIPENLFESELFGYEKGAFTGAFVSHAGKLELANGGTVFLDEIADFPIQLQPKLLRVLEDGIVDRLGSKKPIKVDVRFIAASNRDLESLVASEKFRADLFYRLRVITIRVPPLRERKEDIPLLVNYFIKIISERLGKRITGIEPSILEIFKKYDWPGNIRELKNAVEEMITLSQNETLNILPSFLRDIKSESVAFNQETLKLDIIEEETIKKALQRFGGDKVQAAKSLGISLRTLYRKLKKLNRLN